MNVVVDKGSGEILRAGTVDFAASAEFDAVTEEVVANTTWPLFTRARPSPGGEYHTWDGTQWILGGLEVVRTVQKDRVKAAYLADILWTDNTFLWYSKLEGKSVELFPR